jgi:polysaccharide pyruvyl transferase WcaK-like protein
MTNVLLLGGDADANLGDAGILAATCGCLATLEPRVAITIVSRRRQSRALPGLAKVINPGPASFAALLDAARRQDLIVVGGGGLLQDDDSRIKVPYWASRLLALRLFQRNIVGFSLGVGPLNHAESRASARVICELLNSVSVRDEFARDWLQRCSGRPIEVVPDPAFTLEPAAEADAIAYIRSLGLSTERPLLGVVVRGWFHSRGGFVPRKVRFRLGIREADRRTERERFADSLATEIGRLARRLDAGVLLMPSYRLPHEGDLEASEALAARLDGFAVGLAKIDEPSLYKAVAGQLALMVAARMHPLIFAASMGVPVVGLAYNGKFEGAFRLLGMRNQLLDLGGVSNGAEAGWLDGPVQAAFAAARSSRDRTAALAQRVREHARALLH